MQYGLIGEKLGHSFSKEIHEKIENYEYVLREIKKEDLENFMKEKDFKAINVTIPYKEEVIPYLDFVDEGARKIGAVNTIVNSDGKLYGYNTDFYGLKSLTEKTGADIKDKKVLILGTGGTSRTAYAVAQSLGAREILKVTRRSGLGYITYDEMYQHHKDAEIIINTTPCGMYPQNGESPVELNGFDCLEGVIDVIYNPLCTKLVSDAKKRGLKAECGLFMLCAQAVKAAEFFTGKTYPSDMCEKIFSEIYSKKQNIVLVGMPSSGKTTVGKYISEMYGYEFEDTDDMIVRKHKMTIPEIFEKYGEETFRVWESECVEEISKMSGYVIATGGGAILREENVDCLRQNGKLYFVDRPLELLMPTTSRPLSGDRNALQKRYEERYDIYKSVSDDIILNTGTKQECAERIISQHMCGGVK